LVVGEESSIVVEEAPTAGRMTRGRRIAVWSLVVLASIIALVSILTTWVNRQMLDNKSWGKLSTHLIQDRAVQSSLATEIVNQLYANVDISAQLKQRLPKNLKQLSDPAAAAVREPATRGVEFLLTQPRFQALFVKASAAAHEKLVNVLENKSGNGISTGNGVVTLDTIVLVKQIGRELGLPRDVVAKLPPDAGRITILRSDQLDAAQKGVRLVRVLSVWLLVAVFALYGLALYLARGERRKTLARTGYGLVIVGLLVLIARRLIGNYVVSSLSSEAYHEPAHHVWLITTSVLGSVGWATVMYGLFAIVAALLAGPWKAMVALRREIAPVLNQRQELVWCVAGFLYLLLVYWGPTHALRTWWGILLVGGLLALGIFAWRKQSLEEFPDAGLVPAEASVGTRVAATARRMTVRTGGTTTVEKETSTRSTAEEIAWLVELKEKGAITDAEFEQAKKHALA
jgi:hypothetical protein